MQSKPSTKDILRTEETGRCKEVTVKERKGCNMTQFFSEVQHIYSDKTGVLDQSERALGPIYIINKEKQ